MIYCKQCGRKVRTPKRGLCLLCHNKEVRKRFMPGIAIAYPRDEEQEIVFDGLIKQRTKAVQSPNICASDDPQEELAIRARLGLNTQSPFLE